MRSSNSLLYGSDVLDAVAGLLRELGQDVTRLGARRRLAAQRVGSEKIGHQFSKV